MPRSSLLIQSFGRLSILSAMLAYRARGCLWATLQRKPKEIAKECLSLTPVSPLSYIADDSYRYDQSSVLNGSSVYIFGGSGTLQQILIKETQTIIFACKF